MNKEDFLTEDKISPKGKWYNPIGITLKADSENANKLKDAMEKVKDKLGKAGYKGNMESPSVIAKRLIHYVLNH